MSGIAFGRWEGKQSCVAKLQPLFAQLESFFRKYKVDGQEAEDAQGYVARLNHHARRP